ncbi:MAG: enoyl-CoA hydratase-related protein, partial [Proteobacteria bacterium]|nr:enoyl-CoA hydratase-related protein [Pseudomonadota bacterium]
MDFETIRYELDGGVLTLTLNRPDRLNAFNNTMMHEMIAALDAADADDNVRAIVVTGEGRGFCAGADLEKGGETFDYDAQGRSEDTR